MNALERQPLGADRQVAGAAPAFFVTLGGIAAFLGSFAGWPTVSTGFDFFHSGSSHSGMEAGVGLVTAEIGLLVTVAGLGAIRRQGVSPFRLEAIALAWCAALIVVAYLVSRFLAAPAFWVDQIAGGEFLVLGGAIVAAAAGARLRPPDQSTRQWALACRPALALLTVGMAAWAIGLSGHLGLRIELLTYAVVLVALGFSMWPDPLPGTRLKPTTAGLLLILYGGFWLVAAAFGEAGRGPLEAMPFAVLFAGAVMRVLDLPTTTPRAEPSDGRVEAVLTVIASSFGLLVGALVLTGLALALLIARLLMPGLLPLWLYALGGPPTDPNWLAWLLAAGVVIGAGTVIALVRGSRPRNAPL